MSRHDGERSSHGSVVSRPVHASPFRAALAGYVPLTAELRMYRVLVEALPVLDTALTKLVQLVGCPRFEGSDALVARLEDFIWGVRVNYHQRGFLCFFRNHLRQMLQFGRAAGEVVLDNTRRDIHALVNIDSDTLAFRQTDDPLRLLICQRQRGAVDPVPLPENLLLFNVNDPEGSNPHGTSLFRSLPFVADILLTMEWSIKQTWERMGAPTYNVSLKPPSGVTVTKEQLDAIMPAVEAQFTAAMQARRDQKVIKDFFNANVEVSVIGADGQTLPFQEPYRAICEQVVAKTGLPPYMLGLQWAASERLSTNQAQMIMAQVEALRDETEYEIKYLVDLWQRLTDIPGKLARVGWSEVMLLDATETARARMIDAQAKRIEMDNAVAGWRNGFWDQTGALQMVDPTRPQPAQALACPASVVTAVGATE
jgi:hypothetical protein